MSHSSRYLGYHGSMNRDYLTDGEESQRAPSDRTMSEYIIANDHTTMVKPVVPVRKSRKEKYDQGEERRSQIAQNGRGSVLSGPSRHPLNKSASHGSIIVLHQALDWVIELLVTTVMVPGDQEYQQLKHKYLERMVSL